VNNEREYNMMITLIRKSWLNQKLKAVDLKESMYYSFPDKKYRDHPWCGIWMRSVCNAVPVNSTYVFCRYDVQKIIQRYRSGILKAAPIFWSLWQSWRFYEWVSPQNINQMEMHFLQGRKMWTLWNSSPICNIILICFTGPETWEISNSGNQRLDLHDRI